VTMASYTQFITPLLSATFLTSATMHLLFTRRVAHEQRSRLTAQETILNGLVLRMRAGEHVEEEEYSRLMTLVRARQSETVKTMPGAIGDTRGDTGWWEAVLGRKDLPSVKVVEDVDDSVRREFERALQSDLAAAAKASVARNPAPETSIPQPPRVKSPTSSPSTSVSPEVPRSLVRYL